MPPKSESQEQVQVHGQIQTIPPRSGTSLRLPKNHTLRIIDPTGLQVSDLLAYNLHDPREVLSNGRTFDYANTIRLTTSHTLYSNRSNAMLTITADTVGRHDFLFTPCSRATFRIKFPDQEPHRGCFGNLAEALREYGVTEDMIAVPFNCFMNVEVGGDGGIEVGDPLSRAGDYIEFRAEMDLLVGLTACSAGRSNAGESKEIQYVVLG